MEIELGIVCGRCDWYSPMKTATCPSCGHGLALFPRSASIPPTARDTHVELSHEDWGSGKIELPSDNALRDTKPGSPDTDSSDFVDAGSLSESTPPSPGLFLDPLRPRRTSSGAIHLDNATLRDGRAERSALGNDAGQGPLTTRDSTRLRSSTTSLRQAESPGLHSPSPGKPASGLAGQGASGLSLEELMDQAKNFICRSCSTPVPMGHKFCGRCGAAVPPEILNARTQFFGQLQVPGKAKLILIRGEGVEGLSYQLNAEQHIVGRNGQLVFPDDPFVSPKHANLFYRSGKLVVRDEGSLNGVFLRVRGTVDIAVGDYFLAGEQLFRIDATPKQADGPAPDGTYFYSSPKHQSPFRITQLLQGGATGMTVCARNQGLQIGREGGDLNFPTDLYMSASHCKLEETAGRLTLTDLNSRNGTYVRLKAERELTHGDYLFIGRKLLRVEITAA
ncbi:MAG TPA: FHA domain-containing protein [Polyangiaceae bacterium]|nr:FHA domain-containing protein [Polyangiaceae bacterium]